MTALLLNGLMALAGLMLAVLCLAGLLTLSRRFDRAERRRSYEVECIARSLQALEQQNQILSEKLNGAVALSQRLTLELERSHQQTREQPTANARDPNRLLH